MITLQGLAREVLIIVLASTMATLQAPDRPQATRTSHVIGTVSGGFAPSGTVNYYPEIKRAVWTDGLTVETFSMNGGFRKRQQRSFTNRSVFAEVRQVWLGPNRQFACRIWAGRRQQRCTLLLDSRTTPGSNAASDTFTISSATAVNSDTGVAARTAYNPDQDGFLVWTQPSSGPANVYGVQIARTTTNANKLTSLSGRNYIGFASNSASSGQTVTVQLPSSVATPTQGSLSTNTLYYVKTTAQSERPMRDLALQDAL